MEVFVLMGAMEYDAHYGRQEGDGHTLRQDAESSVWAPEECLALLQQACGRFRKQWVRAESI